MNLNKSNKGHRTFKSLCLNYGASYDKSLYETPIVNHIIPLSLLL